MVPLSTTITGMMSSPQIKADMKGAMTALTQKMVSTQKDKLVGKGTDALTTLITGKKAAGRSRTRLRASALLRDYRWGSGRHRARRVGWRQSQLVERHRGLRSPGGMPARARVRGDVECGRVPRPGARAETPTLFERLSLREPESSSV